MLYKLKEHQFDMQGVKSEKKGIRKKVFERWEDLT